MAKVFADAGSDVAIHARRPEVVAETNVRHQNARYLPDVVLPAVVLPDIVLPDRLRATVDPVETLYRRTAEISPPGRSSLCGGVLIGRP
jgi:glycerol-3-phosphate dehydrogenase